MKRNIQKAIALFLCLAVSLAQSALPATAQEQGDDVIQLGRELYATSAVLLDGGSGRVLYGKNADTPMAMASTTKIMTCIIVLENCALGEELTVSSYAAGMPKVKLYLRRGERYRVEDLLYSMMLESHNDSAAALAEHVGRKRLPELADKDASDDTLAESREAVAAFAGLMNQKAMELGCQKTYFITPNGLDASETVTREDGRQEQREHMTTAQELARIMAYCVRGSAQSGEFLRITRAESHSFAANGRSFCCSNHNAFLQMMDGALSGKTGFTNKAGYCYVGALEREGRLFIVALLACGWPNNKSYKWRDTRKLMEYGISHFRWQALSEICYDERALPALLVKDGQTKRPGGQAKVGLRVQKDTAEAPEGILVRKEEQLRLRCSLEKELSAPVSAGEIVGKIEYLLGDTVYRTDRIVTADRVERIDFAWCLRQIWQCYIGL